MFYINKCTLYFIAKIRKNERIKNSLEKSQFLQVPDKNYALNIFIFIKVNSEQSNLYNMNLIGKS